MSEFRVLGELQLLVRGRPVDLGPLKQRTVLVALLMDAGHIVPTETLIDRTWGEAPPSETRSVLYTYLTRIRRILTSTDVNGAPAGAVLRRSGGYQLDVEPDRVDVHRLRGLAERARQLDKTDPQRTVVLREAVKLVRGEPLAGLPGEWATRVREGLRQQLLGVLVEWAVAEMQLGQPAAVIDRLSGMLDQYPLAEQLILHLMKALQLSGRRAEALEQYARSRRRIVDELGVEPGTELRDLHQTILRDSPAGDPRPQPAEAPAGEPATPRPGHPSDAAAPGCRLPADIPDHTDREPEISQAMTALLDSGAPRVTHPVVILSGPGGVGKTSLSIHLAHLLRSSYPDGQVFVGLGGGATEPGEVLARVLRVLGVATQHKPSTVEDMLAQYRAVISDRRVLIVLDDAVSAEQIRPLVPGTPGAGMILTTRARLTTIPGAERIELRQLGPTESVVLLRRVIGDTRVAAEPEAAATLARLCSGLPLALRIAGARLAARPHWPISRLVERMSDERRRLDEMTADGLAVRMSVAVSYEGLAPAARRMFRLLGFLAVSEFTDWQSAALAAVSLDEAEDLLEQLVDARMLDVVEDLKQHTLLYRMHDLVRIFAHERAVVDDTDGELRTAVERVVGTAIELVDRRRERLPYATPRLYRRALATPAADPSILAADARRPRWTPGEVACLVAVVERASALGMDDAACVLADALVFASFALANDFVGWNRAHTAALRAARINGNRGAEAVIETEIALLRYKEDRFAEAEQHFAAAMALFEFAGDEQGAATARSGLGTVLRELGRHRAAEPLLEQALETFSRINDPAGAAHAAYGLGFANRELGNDDAAVRYLEQAISLYRSLNNWRGEAIAIRGVGLVHRARGELELAASWCGQAHELLIERGDRRLSCYTAQSLAKVWIRQGDVERARGPLEGSLAICREQHDRFGVALVLRTVGEMHLAAGRTDPALKQLAAAHAAWKELDHDLGRARTLRDIGATHAQAGDCEAAHAAWRTAWTTFSDLGTRETAELQAWRQQWGCGCDSILAGVLQPSG